MYNLQKLSLRELRALRKALDYIPITGIDAMFIGMLQAKLITKIQNIEKKEEIEKKPPIPKQIKNLNIFIINIKARKGSGLIKQQPT